MEDLIPEKAGVLEYHTYSLPSRGHLGAYPHHFPSSFHMVRSTIIVRASDALPLAASVDDEQVRQSCQNNSTVR